VDVADSAAIRAAFDGPSNADGWGPCPLVRLLAHAECVTKALLGVAFDGYRVAETTLALRVLASFTPGMLVMADRNFLVLPAWVWVGWRE
jgi:hypothetical protein